jgi:hypothetical protein
MLGLWIENNCLTLRDDLPRLEPPPGEVRRATCRAGRNEVKLDLLARRGMATLVPNGNTMAQGPPAASFDVVIECTGNPRGYRVARRMVRPEDAGPGRNPGG